MRAVIRSIIPVVAAIADSAEAGTIYRATPASLDAANAVTVFGVTVLLFIAAVSIGAVVAGVREAIRDWREARARRQGIGTG